jgi:hypothetical protein
MTDRHKYTVMPGLDPGIHGTVLMGLCRDGRVEPGHDVKFENYQPSDLP